MDERYFKDKFKENEKFERWYTPEEINAFEALTVTSSLVGDEDAFELAKAGDFSKFERLSEAARIYLASKHMLKNYNELYTYVMENYDNEDAADIGNYMADLYYVSLDDEEYMEEQDRKLIRNPLLRLALSVKSPNKHIREEFMNTDSQYNTEVMKATLNPIEPSQFKALKQNGKDDEQYKETADENRRYNDTEMAVDEAAANIDKQVMIAKLMLLAHLGDCYTKDENSDAAEKKAYKGNVANLFAHCSRVSVILPTGADKSVIDAIMGSNRGKTTGVYKRSAATHDVQPRKYDDNGNMTQEYKEIKPKITTFSNQYGMDVPVGGIGKNGITGAGIIKGNGTCGHLYMHVHEGKSNECGAMLLGFESDSPSAEGNQQGHTHSMRIPPIGEKMSSFCAQRSDEFGAKYGGRIIDLSKAGNLELSRLLEEFDEIYRGLMVKAVEANENDAGSTMLKNQLLMLNGQLCSEVMPPKIAANRLCELGVNWQNVRDVLKYRSVENERGENVTVNESVVTVANANLLEVERIKQPSIDDREKYDEYRRSMSNVIRKKNGIQEVRRKSDSYVYKDSEERYNKILSRFMNEGMSYAESYGMPYNNARPDDRRYMEEADSAAAGIHDLSESLKPAGEALADEMKKLSNQIANESMRIYAFDKMIQGERIELKALPENLRLEFSASSRAFKDEALLNKAEAEVRFEILNKALLAIEGKEKLNLTLSEENYLKNFLSGKDIDYDNDIKGKSFKEVLPDDVKTVSIGESFGLTSVDMWKNASDIKLKQVFKNNFAADKKALEQAAMLGYDIYDTIFIYDKERGESKSFREYYGDNPENKEALFMRQLLKREITADVVNYDAFNNVHTATVKIHSEFKEKQPTGWQRLTNTIPVRENQLYEMAMGENAADRREQLKNTMKPDIERINRGAMKRTITLMEDSVKKEEEIFEREIKESVARGKNLTDYNEDELNVNMYEVQLYMLSKGMNMADIMKAGAKKEEKERLAAQYFDMKADPESEEYGKALEEMKTTLASAALPGGNLGNSNNIINNLSQITWLKKATDMFVRESDGRRKNIGNSYTERGLMNINMITEAQLEYIKYFKTDDYINNRLMRHQGEVNYIRNKFFLEACSLNTQGSFYSTVDMKNSEYILNAETKSDDWVATETLKWLADKDGRNVLIKKDEGQLRLSCNGNLNIYSKSNPDGSLASGVRREYMLEEELETKENIDGKFTDVYNESEKIADKKENEIFSLVMQLPAEAFLKYDTDAAAKEEAEDLNSEFSDRYRMILEMIDDYNRGYILNSDIRNKSRILNKRNGEMGNISNGGFNAFPSFTEDEKHAYEEMTGKVIERAEKYKKDALGFSEKIKEKMEKRISDKLKSDLGKTVRRRLLDHLWEKSDEDIQFDIWKKIDDYIKPEDMGEKFDNIKSKKDIEKYIKNHPEIKSLYVNVMKDFEKDFTEYEEMIEEKEKDIKEILKEESKKTPMMKELYESDVRYVTYKNKEAYDKYVLDVRKAVLGYCAAKEMGIKTSERADVNVIEEEIQPKPVIDEKIPEAPEPEKEPPVIKAVDMEITDKQSLESAVRAREIEYEAVVSDIRDKMDEENKRIDKLYYSIEMQPVYIQPSEMKEFIDKRVNADLRARSKADKEAGKTEHEFKQGFIKRAKAENPGIKELKGVKHIKDIEKLSSKWQEKLATYDEGTVKYEDAQKKAKLFSDLAVRGRKEANAVNKKTYNDVLAKEKRTGYNKICKEYFNGDLDSFEAEYEMRRDQVEIYKDIMIEEMKKRDKDIAVIKEKGKAFAEPEKPVKKYSLSDFERTPEQKKEAARRVRKARMEKAFEEEYAKYKGKGSLKEFLTPRSAKGKSMEMKTPGK